MNWMKRLLQFLNSDDDPIENKSEHIRHNKNIEARVTYEYPKGNFRFPLIPDQQNQQPERQPNRHTDRQPDRQFKQRQQVSSIKSNQKKPPERVRTDKKPFRPTETPSPIFGFHKPVQKDSVVEFELPTSIKSVNEAVPNEIYKETIDEVVPTKHLPNQPVHFEKSTEVVTTYSEIEPLESPNLAVEFESIEYHYSDDQVLDNQEDMFTPIESVELLDEEDSLQDEKVDTYDPILVQSMETRESEEGFERIVLELDKPVQSSIEDHHTEVIEQPKKEPEQRRSSIPFNVLMFKQDKQRLGNQETKERPETIQQAQIKQQPQEQIKVDAQEVNDNSENAGYSFPTLSFLHAPPVGQFDDNQWLLQQKTILDQTLRNFKVRAKVVNVTQGPAVTRFEVHPEPGVKVNKITNLSDDIKLSLAAKDIRIEAPIPGKNTIGIEVPNKKSKPVLLKEILQSTEFTSNPSPLTVALGLDISGKPIVTDLQKMPHGLIAGATGSGKSVCINAMLVSLLYKASPDEVKLLLIDPKMVELAPYNHIPHLISPVITDAKAATASLKWAVEEMERRYELFAHTGVRDIGRYNEMVRKYDEKSGKLPYLVIIIDELADLMMVAPGDVEDSICRIAQKARACGIHLILATQRPSVDVITGLIKANIPTRIAFSVSSQVDSRTILDSSGADKLLGRGDMLFLENGSSKPIRVQGNFVSDDEIEEVVNYVKAIMKPTYMFEQDELLKKTSISNDEDELFFEACEFVLEHGGASTSSLQRRFRIGYNRAARLIDMMEEQGIISEARGSKPREVLITEEELANIQEG
ncbi:DNA translocase FtsK [Fredinandcohnia humi]